MAHIAITAQNYKQRSNEIPFAKLPKDLADTHGEMEMYSEFYGQDAEITEVVDLYLQKVNQLMSKPPVEIKPAPPQEKPDPVEEPSTNTIDTGEVKQAGFFSKPLVWVAVGVALIFASAKGIKE